MHRCVDHCLFDLHENPSVQDVVQTYHVEKYHEMYRVVAQYAVASVSLDHCETLDF